MKNILFNRLVVCLATSAFLAIAPTAMAQNVEHSTCIQDTQGLMCKSQASDNNAWVNELGVNKSGHDPSSATASLLSVDEAVISSAQLGEFSNLLIGLTYFVLPAGLALAIFLHDKREDKVSKTLNRQIELLERIWNQNPQH